MPTPRDLSSPRRRRLAPLAGAALGLLMAVGAAAPAHAGVHKVPVGATVTFQGQGWGHGHGFSQYGAQNAARQGTSSTAIVRYYYPGTSFGSAGGTMRVKLSDDSTADTQVGRRSGLVVRRTDKPSEKWSLYGVHTNASRWRIQPTSDGRSAVQYLVGSTWTTYRTVAAQLEFYAGGQPIRLYWPGDSAPYRGILRNAVVAGSNERDTVNVLGMESYLRGVVPDEMPAGWALGALKVQAYAARTYAAYLRANEGHGHYDICDTTACQVYNGVDAEAAGSDKAIAATAGKIITYGGKPTFTQFSSSNGGAMAKGAFPYLAAKLDKFDLWSGNPNRSWTVPVKATRIERQWPQLGRLTYINVVRRDGTGRWGGRVTQVNLQGTKGRAELSGDAFRSGLGLKSTLFTFTVD